MTAWSEWAEIDYDLCIHRTENAILLSIADRKVWIPESVIDPEELPEVGDANLTTLVRQVWAEENGIV